MITVIFHTHVLTLELPSAILHETIMSPNEIKNYGSRRHVEENMYKFGVSIVSANSLAPLGTTPSEDLFLTKFGPRVCMGLEFAELKKSLEIKCHD